LLSEIQCAHSDYYKSDKKEVIILCSGFHEEKRTIGDFKVPKKHLIEESMSTSFEEEQLKMISENVDRHELPSV